MLLHSNKTDWPFMLSTDHVMEIMNISKPTALKLIHQAGFPVIRVGSAIRVPRDLFFKWVQEKAVS